MEIDLGIKYYYIINSNLKMSKGKIAAQVSHVAMQLGERYGIIGRAVILKTNENELRELMLNQLIAPVFTIKDAGLTEVPAGSLTCIGFKENEYTNQIIKHLKLV